MKKLVAVMVAGLSLTLTSGVFAAEAVKLTGDFSVKYEKDTTEGSAAVSGSMYTFRLKGESDLGDGWTLYARLGAQYATQPTLADFNTSAYPVDKKSVAAIDQFGLTYKIDSLVYKLGRQEAAVGTTSLLYSRPETNIGKKGFVDGLSVSGTAGAVDITALIAKEDNFGSQDNKLYAFRAGYSPTQSLNWGLTLGRYQDNVNGSTNHWAVNGSYKFDKSSLTAEYAKSSSNADNKAYAATWNYGLDDKVAIYITAFKVETNGDMGKQSDFDNDNRGLYYGLTYKLSDADGLELVYKDQKTISGSQKNTKLEATYTRSF
ncbi:MAG: hypothetical protein P4N59_21325 [Negativicutes bacterium]|nr:hypothetical protein [Negativicutes bacterium]